LLHPERGDNLAVGAGQLRHHVFHLQSIPRRNGRNGHFERWRRRLGASPPRMARQSSAPGPL